MKTIMLFLKKTAIGGFLILLPILIMYMLMEELLEVVVGLATPIADFLPKDVFDEEGDDPVILAIILILLVSFLLGLATRLKIVCQFGNWIEEKTIGRLPLYQTIKSLTSQFASLKESRRFKPTLIQGPDNQQEFAYLIEDVGNGFMVVFTPRAPTPMAGSIKLIPESQVKELDISLTELTNVISQWGVGSRAILDRQK
jgi:uncharacterized membrane protein